MVTQSSTLYNEAFTVIDNSPRQKDFIHEVTIHTTGGEIKPLAFLGQVINQDFVDTIFDDNRIEIHITTSVYMLDLFPHMDNIIVSIKEIEVDPATNLPRVNPEIRLHQYKGIVERPQDINLQTSGVMGKDRNELDHSDLIQVGITLQDLALSSIKSYALQTIVTDTPTKSFLRSTLGAPKDVKGVHVVTPTGDNHIEHMLIPPGISLTDLPAWIDANEKGIYTTGLGYYLLDSFWYVYPLFNTDRIDDPSEHTLTIINVPKERFSHVETTYGRNGNTVYLLNTGDLKFLDLGEQAEINDGNSIIYSFSNLMSTNTTLLDEDGGALYNQGFKQKGLQKESKANDVSLAKYVKGNTTNHAKMMSQLTSTTGVISVLTWENSNPDLLYPAMPVRLLYQEDEVVKEMVGVLSGITTEKRSPIDGAANQAMSCHSVLTLRLKRKTEK